MFRDVFGVTINDSEELTYRSTDSSSVAGTSGHLDTPPRRCIPADPDSWTADCNTLRHSRSVLFLHCLWIVYHARVRMDLGSHSKHNWIRALLARFKLAWSHPVRHHSSLSEPA